MIILGRQHRESRIQEGGEGGPGPPRLTFHKDGAGAFQTVLLIQVASAAAAMTGRGAWPFPIRATWQGPSLFLLS